MFRRVASNRVIVGGRELRQYVVELSDGKVIGYYPFSEELPFTEWFPGVIELVPSDTDCLAAVYNGDML